MPGLNVARRSPWNKAWAFLVATGVTTVLNFLGMRFVTFFRGVDQRRERVQAAWRQKQETPSEDSPWN